ncbi:efflux transporter outer membrane subunit [Orrella sp. 11846]|uniref:efflux transporter outer membrane subunit n=1 Tax=Orrella sp. 11846 TaxID=3409913 RepID=UPI003B5CC192
MAGFTKWVFRLLPTVLLTGCVGLPSVGPDYEGVAYPGANEWVTVSSIYEPVSSEQIETVLASWWTQLSDPQLDQLIAQALKNNQDIAQARARLLQARARRDVAVSDLYPSLGARGSVAPTNYGSSRQADRTQFDAGFDASWEVDVFGGNRRGLQAAQAQQEGALASLHNVQVTIAAEVAQNYVDLRNAQHRLGLVRRNIRMQQDALQIARWRYEAGLVRQTDVDQARANLAQTQAGLPDLEISVARAANRLAVLVGETPGTLQNLLETSGALPSVPDTIGTAIPVKVLTQRPDVRVAERDLAAQTALIGQQLAQRYPSLDLSGSFSWAAYSLSGLGTIDVFVSRLVARLAMVLFDAGRLKNLVEAQTQAQQAALANYESVILTALEEVENALLAHALSREKTRAWRQAAAASSSAATQSLQLYQSGLVDFEQVLLTQRTELSAQDSLAQARANEVTTLIQLYKALGGGWQPETENEASAQTKPAETVTAPSKTSTQAAPL